MQYDYYASRRTILDECLTAVTQAAEEVEAARKNKDKTARSQAANKMKQKAEKVVKLEPHSAYLWAEFKKDVSSDTKNIVQEAWKKKLEVAERIEDEEHQDFLKTPNEFNFIPIDESIDSLPSSSFLLTIPFILQKPYLSKDDRDFYLLDNPLRREKVFKTPMVAATSWKGALRSAMLREMVFWWRGQEESQRKSEEFAERRFLLALLFGDEKGEEPVSLKGLAKYLDEVGGEEAAKVYRHKVREYFDIEEDKSMPHFRGRLHFFPTFFDNVGLEVINPHDRKTGVGARGPILMECVPAGTTGELTVLYVPFPFGPSAKDAGRIREETADALRTVAEGIRAMLTKYGFGAKTSSGFGTAEERLPEKGVLAINATLGNYVAPKDKFLRLLDERGRPSEVLLDKNGKLISKTQFKKLGDKKPPDLTNAEFEEFKRWYEEHGQAYASGITTVEYNSLSELVQKAGEIADQLRREESDE